MSSFWFPQLGLKNQKKSKEMKIQMKFTCNRRLITAAVAAKKHTYIYIHTYFFDKCKQKIRKTSQIYALIRLPRQRAMDACRRAHLLLFALLKQSRRKHDSLECYFSFYKYLLEACRQWHHLGCESYTRHFFHRRGRGKIS